MDLRNALLKAGKVDKKQKRNADKQQRTTEHQKRKRRKKKKKKTPIEEATTPREVLLSQAAQLKKEKQIKIVTAGAIDEPGRRRFHFVSRKGEVFFLQVSDILGIKLEQGKAAIAEDPRSPYDDYLVVSIDAALKLREEDKENVRFFMQ